MRRAVLGVLLAVPLLLAAPVPSDAQVQGGPCSGPGRQPRAYVAWSGPWARHDAELVVRPDGCGELAQRAYQWCAPWQLVGCDQIEGGIIHYGLRSTFTLDARVGAATSGRMLPIDATGDSREEGIVLRLQDDRMLGVEWGGEERTFCRPWARDMRCGA